MAAALDAGADDMAEDSDSREILTAPEAFEAVREAIKALGSSNWTARKWR